MKHGLGLLAGVSLGIILGAEICYLVRILPNAALIGILFGVIGWIVAEWIMGIESSQDDWY